MFNTFIFGNKKGISQIVANFLQRYNLILLSFDFEIQYLKGKANLVDSLSRLSMNVENVNVNQEYSSIKFVSNVFYNIDKTVVKRKTENDKISSKVY